jgi:hypothetical protein
MKPGGVATGEFRLPATVTDAICRTAGTICGAGCTTIDAQLVAETLDTVVEAQTATPADDATPVTRPVADTVAAAGVFDDHVTVPVAPVLALTAAVNCTVWPTAIVAVFGATVTLTVGGGFVTVTLSPQAAAMIAVAATRDERRTLMNNPLEVKNDCTIPRNMRTTGRIGNPL